MFCFGQVQGINVFEQCLVLHLVFLVSTENRNSYKLANKETVSHQHSECGLKWTSQF